MIGLVSPPRTAPGHGRGSTAGPAATGVVVRRPHVGIPGMVPAATTIERRFAAGDEAALREAFERWGGLVASVAHAALRDPNDVDDVVQDTFVTAWRSRDRFDPERGTLAAWLAGIARNTGRQRLRTLSRAPTPTEVSADALLDDDDALRATADRLVLRAALDELPDGQRAVLELAFLEGHSHAVVAERLGLPVGTVKSHARRGLLALRRRLGGEIG